MDVIVRDFKTEDIDAIDEIYQRQQELGVPGLKNLIVNGTIETEDGRIIGYGAVKLFAEAVLILDKSVSNKEKAKALRETMKAAILISRDAGVEYLYAVASDVNFAEVLKKSYGFRVVPGELLVLDLSSEDL